MSKRKSLSVAEKVALLKDVDSGVRKKDVALKFGIPPSTVSTIIKNRESVLKTHENVGADRKRSKTCKYDDVDEAVLKWVTMLRDKNMPVSGPLIKEKAVEYAKVLGHEEFQASSGWLDKFKKRHCIKEKVISGESGSVSEADCNQWKTTTLRLILEEYEPDNVFNMDETGLFFRCLPNKTLTFKDDKCFGGKHSKERITVVVCANMSGKEKNKLLVIGKSKQPRCFKGVKSLETDYEYNKKSWMTSEIFEKWIVNFDTKMIRQKRKVVLFVDNCPAHPPFVAKKLTNVKLVFFPPNTTSKLQPMDQGVIKNLKMLYRKQILKRLIFALENNKSIDDAINLRLCISEVAKVWQNYVAESTIQNCFIKAGFSENTVVEEISALPQLEDCWNQLQSTDAIDQDISLDEFLSVDEDVIVAEYPTDDDILSSLKDTEDLGDDNEAEEIEVPKPSKKEMMAAFETIRRGIQSEENVPDDIFQSLNKCEQFYEESASNLVQKDIRNYFTTN